VTAAGWRVTDGIDRSIRFTKSLLDRLAWLVQVAGSCQPRADPKGVLKTGTDGMSTGERCRRLLPR
jgi:hypothetical protein